jgi:hypothetical protein
MKMKSLFFIVIVAVAILFSSCSPKSKYDQLVKKELESGERNDSLFMGFYFGMSEKAFYTRCWELNKKGLIRQGTNNTTVEYITKDELKSKATMNFYPDFIGGKISVMPVLFTYTGWAPWNKELSSDKLQEDVLKWYGKVYGDDFITVKSKEKGTAFIKVDGNRRITIFKKDDMSVWAVFSDLLVINDNKVFPVDTLKVKKDTLNLSESK